MGRIQAWAGCVLLGLAVAAAGGCGRKSEEKAAEKMMEKAMEREGKGRVDVDISAQGMTIKSQEGSQEISYGEGAALPKGFPDDVLVYRGAKVVMSSLEGKDYTLMLQSDDAPAKVREAYVEKMSAQGWKQTRMMDMGTAQTVQFEKDGRQTTVAIVAMDGKAQITLHVAAAEEAMEGGAEE